MIKKIADEPKVCKHPQHNPSQYIVLKPGTYEHVCPGCEGKFIFRVRGMSL